MTCLAYLTFELADPDIHYYKLEDSEKLANSIYRILFKASFFLHIKSDKEILQ